ncbi:DUF1499 domain-containing protein [Oricola indica]|jgi:hypothetical protein|uniref:DUF1499 domain-containing protein n=1 Tax=Oricola indica TaxID=2872591 RepID=UPI001CBE3BC7|nr:DUF1499 domain-containing protein [Oricola indica]
MAMLKAGRRHEPVTLRPLPERKRSHAAGWSLRLASFAPVLAIVILIAHNMEIVDTPNFLLLIGCVALVALLALFLVGVAFRSLWTRGTRGGQQAIWALFLVTLTLAPFVLALFAWIARPQQSDVSTDLIDPPLLSEELRTPAGGSAAQVAAQLRNGYPNLTGRRFKAAPDAIEETILAVGGNLGWTLVSRRGRIGADDELLFEFAYSIPVIGIPGTVVLRLTDEGDTSFIDMRARTDFVTHDLGWNAWLIDRYLKALDFQLIGIVEA